jgi:hypothetical protein
VVIFQSNSRIRGQSIPDQKQLMQSALETVTHQKKSMFLVAIEELASAIVTHIDPVTRALGSRLVSSTSIYNMRLLGGERKMSTLNTVRSFYRQNVPSADAPSSPRGAQPTDRLDAVVSAGLYGLHRVRSISFDHSRLVVHLVDEAVDGEITARHALSSEEERERNRLAQFEAGAQNVVRFLTQGVARSEALKRASAALDGQVELLHANAARQCVAERLESVTRRDDINRFFDQEEAQLLKPESMDWIDIEVQKSVAEHLHANSFFPNIL